MPHSKRIGNGEPIESLYVLDISHSTTSSNSICQTSCINFVPFCHNYSKCHNPFVWHFIFGHLSDKIRKLLSNKIPFHLSHDFSTSNCNICILAKFWKLSFIASNNVSASPFDLIHRDIWGPYKNPTYDGKRFFLTMVDDCSRFTWIVLLQHKYEASNAIKKFF